MRDAYPDKRLELIANPSPASLALSAGLADAVHSVESAGFAPFFTPNGELPGEWRERFRGAGRVISFLHDPDGILEENARRAGANSWISGPHRPQDGRGLAARQFAEPIERALGLAASDPSAFRLQLDCAAHEEAELILQRAPWIAVHPGSGSLQKNWPADRWSELGVALLRQRSNLRLLLLGGEADTAAIAAISQSLPPERVRVVEHAPLPRVAALMAACDLFLGHDSGISHLAAATGIPAVLLFGPSDPAVWAPPQPRVRIIRAAGGVMSALDVATVMKILAEPG